MYQFSYARLPDFLLDWRGQDASFLSLVFAMREVRKRMNDWSTDGRGNVRSSAVVGWRAEVITGDETGDVLLRIEFSVDPNLTDVSALQFRLTRQQADHIGGTLGSLADQSSSSAAPADCRKAFVSR